MLVQNGQANKLAAVEGPAGQERVPLLWVENYGEFVLRKDGCVRLTRYARYSTRAKRCLSIAALFIMAGLGFALGRVDLTIRQRFGWLSPP